MVGVLGKLFEWRAAQRRRGLKRVDVWVPNTPIAKLLIRGRAKELVRQWENEKLRPTRRKPKP